MKRSRLLASALVVVTVVLTAACSSGTAGTGSGAMSSSSTPAAAATGAQPVKLTVGNGMSFDPSNFTVHAGDPVQLTLQNTGPTPHDFTLADGVGQPVKITVMGGQTTSGTFTIDKPGMYSFECSMPGHASAGMRGTITAQ